MIKIRGLTKEYATKGALKGLDAEVAPGEVCGLIGSNGAGKTTLLRILSTVLRPTAGEVSIADYDIRKDAHQIRGLIGYMPDSLSTYEEIRVDTFLEFFAHLYNLPRDTITRTIGDILTLVDLTPLRHSLIETLSLGSRQRLSLGRVLLHNPEVLLLDEPVSGLDPRARVEMRALLKELGSMGKSILISSHVLTDLVDLCDRLLIIEWGEKVFSGSFQELEDMVAAEKERNKELERKLTAWLRRPACKPTRVPISRGAMTIVLRLCPATWQRGPLRPRRVDPVFLPTRFILNCAVVEYELVPPEKGSVTESDACTKILKILHTFKNDCHFYTLSTCIYLSIS